MLIASKYEDIYPPPIQDFIYITDNAYTQKDIVQMEYDILKELDFKITTPSPWQFLNWYSKLAHADQVTFNLARYLIELPLIEYRMLKYSPSIVAAAAVYVSFHVLKKRIEWAKSLEESSRYSES